MHWDWFGNWMAQGNSQTPAIGKQPFINNRCVRKRSQGDAWREMSAPFPKWAVFSARIEYETQRRADQSAIIDQPAPPDHEHLNQWLAGEFPRAQKVIT